MASSAFFGVSSSNFRRASAAALPWANGNWRYALTDSCLRRAGTVRMSWLPLISYWIGPSSDESPSPTVSVTPLLIWNMSRAYPPILARSLMVSPNSGRRSGGKASSRTR